MPAIVRRAINDGGIALDFATALKMAKTGSRIQRTAWGSPGTFVQLVLEGDVEQLVVHNQGSATEWKSRWNPMHDDMLAMDWEIAWPARG